jgi:predicted DNA-binding protein
MDTTRWKSILVPREVYEEIKALSKSEGRTIGGQLRLVFEWYTEAERRSNDSDGSNTG